MSYFLRYHNCDFSGENDMTIRICVGNNKVDLVKYFLTLPGVNALRECQLSIWWALHRNNVNMLKYLINMTGIEDDEEFIGAVKLYLEIGEIEIVEVLLTHQDVLKYINHNYNRIKMRNIMLNRIEIDKLIEKTFQNINKRIDSC
jgi:hypothetical protein